jgi:hypothetical protein
MVDFSRKRLQPDETFRQFPALGIRYNFQFALIVGIGERPVAAGYFVARCDRIEAIF